MRSIEAARHAMRGGQGVPNGESETRESGNADGSSTAAPLVAVLYRQKRPCESQNGCMLWSRLAWHFVSTVLRSDTARLVCR